MKVEVAGRGEGNEEGWGSCEGAEGGDEGDGRH